LKGKYNQNVNLQYKSSNSATGDALFVGGTTLLGTLGISALVIGGLGASAAITAATTGFWAAAVVWWTGATISGIGLGGALAALATGPWGWVALGGMAISSVVGYGYYQRIMKKNKMKLVEGIIIKIETLRSKIVSKWRI